MDKYGFQVGKTEGQVGILTLQVGKIALHVGKIMTQVGITRKVGSQKNLKATSYQQKDHNIMWS